MFAVLALAPVLLMAAEGAVVEGAAAQAHHTDTATYLLNHVKDGYEWEMPGGNEESSGVHEADVHAWFGKPWLIDAVQVSPGVAKMFGLPEGPVDITPTK